MAKELAELKDEANMAKHSSLRFCYWIHFLDLYLMLIVDCWLLHAVFVVKRCRLEQETQGYMLLITCLLLHPKPSLQWRHSYQKQKSEKKPLVAKVVGIKFDLSRMLKTSWIISSIWHHLQGIVFVSWIVWEILIFKFNKFRFVCFYRCQVWEKEVACREKDTEIRGLKEKIVNLIRQIEMHKAELIRQEKLKVCVACVFLKP